MMIMYCVWKYRGLFANFKLRNSSLSEKVDFSLWVGGGLLPPKMEFVSWGLLYRLSENGAVGVVQCQQMHHSMLQPSPKSFG